MHLLKLSLDELNYLVRLMGIDIRWQRKYKNEANEMMAKAIYKKLKAAAKNPVEDEG